MDTASRQQTWIPAFAGMTEMDETMIKTDNFISALGKIDELALCGGLRISKSGIIIDPSCCAVFQDWRDWELLLKGGIKGLWLGHDPSTWANLAENEIAIWSDEKNNPQRYKISSTISEVKFSLKRVKAELMAVSEIISKWATANMDTDHI